MTTTPFSTLRPPLKARSYNADSQVQPWSDCLEFEDIHVPRVLDRTNLRKKITGGQGAQIGRLGEGVTDEVSLTGQQATRFEKLERWA